MVAFSREFFLRIKLVLLFYFFCYFFGQTVSAAYYDTLPKGVRNLTYQLTKTNQISGRYTNSGNLQGYNINANINADAIKGFSGPVDIYLGTLSADDYKNFSFGTFQGDAKSNVTVQGLGGGYGITDKLTVYGFIPFYNATVDLQVERTIKGRTNIGTAVQIENVPEVDIRLIQSVFVNLYKYQPLGKWQASDFGDFEMGFLYQVKKWNNAGALMSMGFVAPTGKIDNPDILQDVAFGDGQWDVFFEHGVGITPKTKNRAISFDLWNRVTYQFPFQTELRLPDSLVFPITAQKGNVKVKYGNKIQTNLRTNYQFNDEWGSSLTYTFDYKEKDQFKSSSSAVDEILADATERSSHTARVNFNFTTLKLFQDKKFLLPLNVSLALQTIFAGKNTPKYERGDFQVQMFF